MAEALFFAPLRVPLVDSRTGLMAREWYLFFQGLWARSGGPNGPDVNDLVLNAPQALGTADILALFFSGLAELQQIPTVIGDLRERVAALETELQALKAGSLL